MAHLVRLDAFHGPLDLLLYLVKRNEVDVLDIPIATVAEQFLAYVLAVKELDIEFAGEFLVMSATLMEIKSRTLLPAEEVHGPDDRPDPRRELVRQLLEYRKFKDAAAALEARAEAAAERVARVEPPEPDPVRDRTPPVRQVELWDLVSAFARLMRETQSLQPATIAVDDTPQHVYEAQLKALVAAAGGRLPFGEAFPPPRTKPRLIGIFLAVLELIRHHGLGLDQPEPGGDIFLIEVPDSPPEPPPDVPPDPEPASVS